MLLTGKNNNRQRDKGTKGQKTPSVSFPRRRESSGQANVQDSFFSTVPMFHYSNILFRSIVYGLLSMVILTPYVFATDVYIGVQGDGTFRRKPSVLLKSFSAEGKWKGKGYEKKIEELVEKDITKSDFLNIKKTKHFLSDVETDYDKLLNGRVDYVVFAKLTGAQITYSILNVRTKKSLMQKEEFFSKDSWRDTAHKISDDIIFFLTGQKGINTTRITFISDVSGTKEVWVIDSDGEKRRRITYHGSITLLPRWHPEGEDIVYTSYVHGNPDLFWYNAKTKKHTLFSMRQGLNTSASFSPNGKKIALTLTVKGYSQICILDKNGKFLRQITRRRCINTSPAFSPDGNRIAFISDKTGIPQIYVVEIRGGVASPVTFEPTFKDSPEWSPKGDSIVFVSLVDGNKNICVLNVATGKITQLTQFQGNNENPSWSPDGRYVCFTSTRNGRPELFVMRADGKKQRKLGNMKGNIFSPKWSPFRPSNK